MLKNLDKFNKLDVWDKIGNIVKEDLLRKHSLKETIMLEDDVRETPVRETLAQQNEWLSEENRKLIERNIHLLGEKEKGDAIITELNEQINFLTQSQAELREHKNAKECEQNVVTQLRGSCEELKTSNEYLAKEASDLAKKCAEVTTERDSLLRAKNTLTEKLKVVQRISDEIEMLELLTEEIQQLSAKKTELSAAIESLEKKKGFTDLHYWIRTALCLGDLASRKTTRESRQRTERITAKMKDLALYGDIHDLYGLVEDNNFCR